jgi:heavy metal translocating P-type ATPase
MDTLISIGALAAYGYSAWAVLAGEPDAYFDTAVVIVTLILVGKVLEARARMTAGDASRALLERGAKEATLLEDGRERRVTIDDLVPGSLVVVRPGEKVPADGVVREGTSWMDLSLLTGESVPVDVGPGDEVVGAAINGTGRLVVFVSAVGSQTKLADIVRSLERAQGSQAPVQRLADRISSVFVPIVLLVAALTLIGWIVADPSQPATALLHAVAVLLIACPCALGLATPAAVMTGTGRGAQLGILFKDGGVLETAHDLDVVLLDKTGTLTEGSMSVVDVVPLNGFGTDEVLALAAAAESGSEHPIARAVLQAARGRDLGVRAAHDHQVRPGAGAVAVIDGTRIRVGRPDEDDGVAPLVERLGSGGATPFGVWEDDELVGLMSVSDLVKADAAASIRRLHELGLQVQLISGDRRSAAEAVAADLDVDHVVAEVLPDGKAAWVERLRSQGWRVAFVGDGINDAPALAAADVGIAMGTGTDVALAAADVQLMGGRLSLVPDTIQLGRRTFRIIRENLFWAFAYNVVMIPLAVLGMLTPMWAAAAMAASSVSVVLNSLRLRRYRAG